MGCSAKIRNTEDGEIGLASAQTAARSSALIRR